MDGITYATIASPTTPYYLDTAVTVGTLYYYQVQATGTPSSSAFTAAISIVPTPNGEMSMAEIRLRAQQRCDRVGSNFVTTSEWNSYINQSLFELYDLLITSDLEYYVAPFAFFQTVSGQNGYNLPDGVTQFQQQNGTLFTPPPFYKLVRLTSVFRTRTTPMSRCASSIGLIETSSSIQTPLRQSTVCSTSSTA